MIAVIILASLLGGVVLATVGFFCWHLLQSVKSLRLTLDRFVNVFEPFTRDRSFQKISANLEGILHQMKIAAPGMRGLSDSLEAFCKVFFNMEKVREAAGEEQPQPRGKDGFAPEGASATYSYSEEEASSREVASELRKNNIETDANAVTEPDPSQMRTDNQA